MLTFLYKILLLLNPIILIPSINLKSSESHINELEPIQTTIKPLKLAYTCTGPNKIFNYNVILPLNT